MGQDFVAYLPFEIITDILLRLPSRSFMTFRCVCKFWLNFTETHEFIKSYFQKSSFSGGLALFQDEKSLKAPLKLLEFHEGNSAYPYRVGSSFSFSFSFPHRDVILHSSANGLLFLSNRYKSRPHLICNPITFEYIKLPPPNEASYLETYGFGASKPTGQYKVVRLFRECSECPFKLEVYTVGTGLWRSVAVHIPLTCSLLMSKGVFFNGNLHWLERNSHRILCFHLETERFSTFFAPALVSDFDRVCALGDCFYLCKKYFHINNNTVLWSMNENEDGKSWREECEVHDINLIVPIKIFRDGDILFADEYRLKMYYYSSQTKTIREIKCPDSFGCRVVTYTPSFLQLKTEFAMENVSSF